jgi:hypothetical protein
MTSTPADTPPPDTPPPDLAGREPSRVDTFHAANVEGLDRIEAREIGFDFARRGMNPPEDCGTAFKEGWLEARARFGASVDAGTQWDRKLLRLRLSAWRRCRLVDRSVTAAFLEQISVPVCPITREALTTGTHSLSDATIDRVFNGGAYAAGNIAVLSRRANQAKANRTIEEIIEIAERLPDEERHEGLLRHEWARLASLCSLALPLDHALHVRPLLVWPPRRLLLSNAYPVVMVGTSLMAATYLRPAVTAEVRALLGSKRAKKTFDEFFETFRWRLVVVAKGKKTPHVLHRFEDTWSSDLVWRRFEKFRQATPAEDIGAIRDAIKRALAANVNEIPEETLRGWATESGGYLTKRRDDL